MKRGYYDAAEFEATESLGFLVRRCATLMTLVGEAASAQLQPQLTLTQWMTLMRLRTESPLLASVLAAQIGHDLGAMTRVIEGLAADGLVLRTRSLTDRRGTELSLTAKGRRLTDARLPLMLERLNRTMSIFSRAEADQLHALLKRLIPALENDKEILAAAKTTTSTRRDKTHRSTT